MRHRLNVWDWRMYASAFKVYAMLPMAKNGNIFICSFKRRLNMSKSRIFSFFFVLTSLLVVSLPSLCFADDCNYSYLVEEDGKRVTLPKEAGCAPDCPEDTVIRYNLFTHQFSCDTNTERRFDSIVVKKQSPTTTTTTY